jgi:hypothetical protein
MPKLPSSRRQVLLGAGLSNTTPFVSSNEKVVPTEVVMDGSANFAITVSREAKVEGAGGKGPKHDVKPAAPPGAAPAVPAPTPKIEDKPKGTDKESN